MRFIEAPVFCRITGKRQKTRLERETGRHFRCGFLTPKPVWETFCFTFTKSVRDTRAVYCAKLLLTIKPSIIYRPRHRCWDVPLWFRPRNTVLCSTWSQILLRYNFICVWHETQTGFYPFEEHKCTVIDLNNSHFFFCNTLRKTLTYIFKFMYALWAVEKNYFTTYCVFLNIFSRQNDCQSVQGGVAYKLIGWLAWSLIFFTFIYDVYS